MDSLVFFLAKRKGFLLQSNNSILIVIFMISDLMEFDFHTPNNIKQISLAVKTFNKFYRKKIKVKTSSFSAFLCVLTS